ncbi:MAG: hypothetical protein ACLRMJ_09980 [Alistipes finegoldii]
MKILKLFCLRWALPFAGRLQRRLPAFDRVSWRDPDGGSITAAAMKFPFPKR